LSATDPQITRDLRDEFLACQVLLDFATAHRPRSLTASDAQQDVILSTYARSSKTYQGILRLAFIGYGQQALMLGRSLFEDMVIAHWVGRVPSAPAKLERFRLYTIELLRQQAFKHKRDDLLQELPSNASRNEREELRQEFAQAQNWTGLSLEKLLKAVEDGWPPGDRELLWQFYDLAIRNANHQLHHGPAGLMSLLVKNDPDSRKYDLRPSPQCVKDALGVAFISYAQALSLVTESQDKQELQALYDRHRLPFVTVVELPENGG
jgi:hypothetical protein